jgi:hypothetical protein
MPASLAATSPGRLRAYLLQFVGVTRWAAFNEFNRLLKTDSEKHF